MGRPRKTDPIKYCAYCGNLLSRKRFGGRLEDLGRFLLRKYCGQDCMEMGMMHESPNLAALRKRSQRLKGTACDHCGATEKLHIHHEDRNPANNSPSNLMTLCASCHLKHHWKTDTSGFRHDIRKSLTEPPASKPSATRLSRKSPLKSSAPLKRPT